LSGFVTKSDKFCHSERLLTLVSGRFLQISA